MRQHREQLVYQFSAIAATSGIAALTVASVWYKFYFHVPEGAPFPWVDMLGTLALVGGGAVSAANAGAEGRACACSHDYMQCHYLPAACNEQPGCL